VIVVNRRLYLTADKQSLVEDGDPTAAYLWHNTGQEVLPEEAARVGYTPTPDPVEDPVLDLEPEPEPEPLEANHTPKVEAKKPKGRPRKTK
jgi:hypothetical protein